MINNSIKEDYSNLKTFVINLDDYKENYIKQLPYLESIGLKAERFSGINALKDEHLKPEYKQYISNFALHFTPKSVIGCALSHILCCKHIFNNYINTEDNNNAIEVNESSYGDKTPFFLIMEDDAFPKYYKSEFFERLNKTIYEISLLDPNWEIIQLHSDGLFPTENTYNTHYISGSTAGYIICINGIIKNINNKIYSHIDVFQHNFITYKKYRSKENLFYTNEKNSLNRSSNYNIFFFIDLIFEILIEKNNMLRGEKNSKTCLNLKLLKEPLSNKELSIKETLVIIPIFLYILLYVFCKKNYFLSYFINLYFMYNYYSIFEKNNYNCLFITHLLGFLLGIVGYLNCLKNKTNSNLNYYCLQLSYGMINFHLLDLNKKI